MIKPTIKTVTPSSADQAVSTVVLAFSADPAARWLYPDPHQYLRNFPGFVRAFAGKSLEYNSAYYVDGYLGRRSGFRRQFILMKRHWPD
jgi:hypothetical protein